MVYIHMHQKNGLTNTDYDIFAYDPDGSLEKVIIDGLPPEQTSHNNNHVSKYI